MRAFHDATHASVAYMRAMIRRKLIKDPPFDMKDIDRLEADLKIRPCHGCNAGKATRLPFKKTRDLEGADQHDVVVYFDNYGKTKTAAIGGYHYYSMFATRRSKWRFVYLLKKEKDLPKAFDRFCWDLCPSSSCLFPGPCLGSSFTVEYSTTSQT